MRRLSALLVALLVVSLVTGCSREAALVVYCGRPEELMAPLFTRFTSQTGITLDVRYGSSAELALRLREERAGTPADVFISQTPGPAGFLADQQLLAGLPPEITDLVDRRFRHAGARWVGLSGRQRVMAYNPEQIAQEELPGSLLQVVEEPWAGQVGLAPADEAFADVITALRSTAGPERAAAFIDGLVDTAAPTSASSTAVVEAVAAGSIPMGLVGHPLALRLLEQDPSVPIANHRFDDGDLGGLFLPTTGAVTAASERAREGHRLLAFLLSVDAQADVVEAGFEYALVAGVPPPLGAPPLTELTVPYIDLDLLGRGFEQTMAVLEESGLGS